MQESTHIENGRRVTDWREETRGGERLRVRWVYDARDGVEAWDEEIGSVQRLAQLGVTV